MPWRFRGWIKCLAQETVATVMVFVKAVLIISALLQRTLHFLNNALLFILC